MKVSCPSCDSKYTIADDKVVGKKIKVRCKTCSTQILVDGTVPQEPDDSVGDEPESDAWTVNLSESEERKMTTAEIVDSAIRNQLGDDVFVWKEGMGDWVLFMDVPEIRAAIESAKKSAPGASKPMDKSVTGGQSPLAPKAAPRPAGGASTDAGKAAATSKKSVAPKATESIQPPATEQVEEKRGPIVAAPGSALARKLASAKSAAAAPKVDSASEHPKEIKSSPEQPKEIKSEPAQKAATRLANKRAKSTHDLFAAVDKAGAEIDVDTSEVDEPEHAKATGARNENSVLFSLDALKSGLTSGGAPTKQAAAAHLAPGPRKKAPGPPTKRLEDLMTFEAAPPGMGGMNAMGGGGLLLSGNDALLTAPAPPPPKPEPKPVPVASATLGAEGYAPPRRSKIGVIVGVVVGIAIVGTAGAVIALKLASHDTPPTASADLSAKAPAASALASPSASASATAVASATATPDAGAPAATASASTSAAPEKVSRVSAVGRGASESKTEKKPEPKVAEPSAPAVSGTFSKDAAVAALSVAASQATVCKKPEGPWGSGKALVTFAPSGRVTTANVSGAPFGGTPVGGCVANVFRRAKIPAFSGDAVTVSKSFTISP